MLLASSDTKLLCLARNGVHILRLDTGDVEATLQVTPMSPTRAVHIDGCRCMALLPGEQEVLIGYNDDCARVWRLGTAEVACRLEHACPVVACCCPSPRGSSGGGGVLITGDDRRHVRVWRRTGSDHADCALTFRPAGSAPITHIADLPGPTLRVVVATWDVNLKARGGRGERVCVYVCV